MSSDKVAVSFIDEASGERIASSNLPLDQLPDTFALETKLDLAGTSYVVVRAEPRTKAEFATTKQLSIGLRRLAQLDPSELLFSLPTLCGAALPAVAIPSKSEGIAVLHEDDWRQCELVSLRHAPAIAAELADIRRIHAEEAAAVGWRKIHVRERIGEPLTPGLGWGKVAQLVGNITAPLGGIAFGQRETPVANARGAILAERVILWGVDGVDTGSLSALCLENLDSASPTTISKLQRLTDALSCALVDWCRCRVYTRDAAIEYATALWPVTGSAS